MKKQIFTLALMIMALAGSSMAQVSKETVTKKEKPKVYKANPEDVGSIDAIIKATYDVISGGVGEKRDWNRFHSLFYKNARMMPLGKNRQGVTGMRQFTPEEYRRQSENALVTLGFQEKEISRRVEVYGNIAHVFSTYEGYKQAEKKPFLRGINSFQLLNDGKRWWVVSIFWLAETPDNPLPAKYLKK